MFLCTFLMSKLGKMVINSLLEIHITYFYLKEIREIMMAFDNIITELALIYAGAAVLATLFLFLRQPIIISYIALGLLVGPYGLKLINNAEHIEKISHIGIILLLFLIGLNLHPNKLYHLFKKTALVTSLTCLLFATILGAITFLFGYTISDSIIVGLALMFSSTVVGLKLLPSTDLHNNHIGEMMISVLLFQDILAILLVLFLKGDTSAGIHIVFGRLLLNGVLLSVLCYYVVKHIILPLFRKFDVIQEYIFIITIGWCLMVAGMADFFGLSYEIGAFIGGVTLATSPISLIISEKLKSLREFFLILFFFAIGSQYDLSVLQNVALLSVTLLVTLTILKPIVFKKAFFSSGEKESISTELGFRLGQASEFALIVAYIALGNKKISGEASSLIQLTVIASFIVSTYIVSHKYKTPIGAQKEKRKD